MAKAKKRNTPVRLLLVFFNARLTDTLPYPSKWKTSIPFIIYDLAMPGNCLGYALDIALYAAAGQHGLIDNDLGKAT
jgi:hypothetical protein